MDKRNFLLSMMGGALFSLLTFFPTVTNATVSISLPSTDALPATSSTSTYYYLYNIGANAYLTDGSYYGSALHVTSLTKSDHFLWTTDATSNSASSNTLVLKNNPSSYTFDNGVAVHVFADGDGSKGQNWNYTLSTGSKYFTIQNTSFHSTTYLGVTGASNVVTTCADNDYSHWIFVASDNIDLFSAKVALYKMICIADNAGISITDAESAYNDASATTTSLSTALATLENNVWTSKISGTSATSPKDVSYLIYPLVNNGGTVGIQKLYNIDHPVGWTVSKGAKLSESTNGNTAGLLEYFNEGTFDLYQTVLLKAGYYKFQINAFERITGDNKTNYTAGTEDINALIYATLGGTTISTELKSLYDETPATIPNAMTNAKTAFDAGYYKNNLVFYVPTDEKVTLGLKNDASMSSSSWVIMANPILYYLGSSNSNISLSEDDNYTPTPQVGTVSVSRSLTADKWAAMVLPYDIPSSAIETVFGTGATVANLVSSTSSNNVVTLNYNTTNKAIKANVPFLVKAGEAKSSVSYDYALTTTDAASIVNTSYASLSGTYDNIDNLYTTAQGSETKNIFFIKDGAWWNATSTSTVSMKPFRSYLSTTNTSEAASLKMTFDGIEDNSVVTAINSVQPLNCNANIKYYNLNGQRVMSPTKGLYIVEGKKIFINQ